jgi:hypothetical protein
MKFEIDLNREQDDDFLLSLGAKEEVFTIKSGSYSGYYIEVNTFEELEDLIKETDKVRNGIYSAIISFDPPTIYLDKDV